MIEVRSLEVRFDVDGSDEVVFARLFAKFIAQWSRNNEQRGELDALAARDRLLGDREEKEPS